MARTLTPQTALAPDVILDGETLLASQQLMTQHREEVLARFGDGLPYDRLRYLDNTRKHMARSAEEALAAGRCLLVMKELEAHGEWLEILAELSLDHTLAKRMMQASLKFGGVEAPAKLVEAAKSKSKLFELMVLDDEDLQALNDGGSVAGLELDDVERMPVSQLRKALREAREDKKALAQVNADKNAKIDELAAALAKKPKVIVVQPVEEAKQLRQEVVATAYEVESTLQGTLRKAFTDLEQLAQQTGEDHRSFTAALVRNLEVTLMAIRSEFHLPELHPDQLPGWQTLLGLDDLAEG